MSDSQSERPRIRLRQPPAVGPGNEPAAPLPPESAGEVGESSVQMVFPKEVVITDDRHRRIRFPPGLCRVPASLANHWYLQANGVTRAQLDSLAAADPDIINAPPTGAAG